MTERHGVVRYPTYYVVIDKADRHHRIVFESRSRARAHAACDALNEVTRPDLLAPTERKPNP